MKSWWRRFFSPRSPDSGEGRLRRQRRGTGDRGAASAVLTNTGPNGAEPMSATAVSPDSGGRRDGLVDAHVHVFPPEMIQKRETYLDRDPWFSTLYGSPEARMATADEVVAEMDASGVSCSIIFGFAFNDQGLCRMVNDYVLEAAGKHPGRLVGLACVSPGVSGAKRELERCLDAGMCGCGELAPDGQSFGKAWIGRGGGGTRGAPAIVDSDGLDALADCLRERGLPLLVHANEPVGHHYPGKGRFTPEACLAFARGYPGLSIVFAHLGGGLFLYEMMPEVRRLLADVYYDTAAAPYLYGSEVYSVVVSSAGPEKLMFGSDYPLLSPAKYLEGLRRLGLAEYEAVASSNARRVFRL